MNLQRLTVPRLLRRGLARRLLGDGVPGPARLAPAHPAPVARAAGLADVAGLRLSHLMKSPSPCGRGQGEGESACLQARGDSPSP